MMNSISTNPPSGESQTYTKIPTLKILLWLAMVSMVMMFAGITSGYIVRQAEGNWLQFDLPIDFYISTVLILISSISAQFAWASVKKNNLKGLKYGLLVTLGLGLVFAYTQIKGWGHLVDQEVFFAGNPSGSFLYVLTGLHLVHLFGGILYLLTIVIRSMMGSYHAQSYLPVELCVTYWHFLDGLWVYLFLFLLFVG